jgi:hypothetical protein
VLSEANAQIAAAKLHGVKLAWYVSNQNTAATLLTFFKQVKLPVDVIYFPGP